MSEYPPRIQLLPDALINQIAAGEVIERPASVVKELLENSLDAGARSIQIDIEDGGLRLIRVTDDGHGIDRADLPLATQRHATSKISTLADLERVRSLGFRGEALSSIAAIARLTLATRTRDSDIGWSIQVDNRIGDNVSTPTAHNVGTSVEVRNLFFSTPARRKFMRSERSEFLQIQQFVRRIALSRHDVAFRLAHNERAIVIFKAANREQRLREVCGGRFVNASLQFEVDADGLRSYGWLGSPDDARSQSDQQFLYVNGRSVRDKTLSHALRRAYQTLIPDDRHPAYVVFIELDPAECDVNVHPTKAEVRFRENRLVHDLIYSGAHNALSPGNSVHMPAGIQEPAPAPYDNRHGSEPGRVARGDDSHHRESRTSSRMGSASRNITEATPGCLSFFDRYLITTSSPPLLIDLEAMLFRQAMSRIASGAETDLFVAQPLLFPVRLENRSLVVAQELLPLLRRLGFQVRQTDPGTVIAIEVPMCLRGVDLIPLWNDLLIHFDNTEASRDDRQARTLRCIATHGARSLCANPQGSVLKLLIKQLVDDDAYGGARYGGVSRRVHAADFLHWLNN